MTASMGKSVIAVVAISAGLFGLIAWRVRDHQRRSVTNRVILFDNSMSVADDPGTLIGLVEAGLKEPHLNPPSTIVVMTLGDARTSNEPRIIASYEVPFSRRALEGRAALTRRKTEILDDVEHRASQFPRTDHSPIFLAVKRSVEQLRSGGCQLQSECWLDIRTDALETSEKTIRTALERAGIAKGMPSPIPNEGITIRFCGLAETNASSGVDAGAARSLHNPQRNDRLREVWSSLFTVPAQVSFEPYCPKPEIRGAKR